MRFTGIITPIPTPFNDDGSINFDALGRNMDTWNSWDLDGEHTFELTFSRRLIN
jgi:hypothetical protein